MNNIIKNIKAFAFILVLILLDQLTKIWAAKELIESKKSIIEGVLELTYTENRGAAFGILQNGTVFFIIVSLIILAAMVFLYIKTPAERRYKAFRIILLFITAGALGNLIDRILRGYVVDFIYVKIIDFPVFNLADIYITCATIALIIYIIFFTKEDFFSFLSSSKRDKD